MNHCRPLRAFLDVLLSFAVIILFYRYGVLVFADLLFGKIAGWQDNPDRAAFLINITFIVIWTVVPFVCWLYWTHGLRQDPMKLGLSTKEFNWNLLLAGALVALFLWLDLLVTWLSPVLRELWAQNNVLPVSEDVGMRFVSQTGAHIWYSNTWVKILSSVGATVVIAPIAEEVFFRGFVIARLKNAFSPSFAVIISALLFAAIHLENLLFDFRPERFIYLLSMGIVFGVVVLWRKSLVPTILAHALNNFLFLIFSLI